MEYPPSAQLNLFDAETELSSIGVTRRQLSLWSRNDLISFDPSAPKLERWMLTEAVFIRDLTKVEWSLNALRKLLAPLKPPYLLDHGRHFFNFKEMQWQRRYAVQDLYSTAVMENPEHAGEVARALVRTLAFLGARTEVVKTLSVLREVLPDDWWRDVLPEDEDGS